MGARKLKKTTNMIYLIDFLSFTNFFDRVCIFTTVFKKSIQDTIDITQHLAWQRTSLSMQKWWLEVTSIFSSVSFSKLFLHRVWQVWETALDCNPIVTLRVLIVFSIFSGCLSTESTSDDTREFLKCYNFSDNPFSRDYMVEETEIECPCQCGRKTMFFHQNCEFSPSSLGLKKIWNWLYGEGKKQ